MSEAKHSPLIDCPFCGSSDIDAAFAKWGDGAVSPGCMSCGATAETQEAWNTRAATSLHHELVAALEEALDEFGISPNDCPSDHWAVRASALLQKAKQGDKQ